MKVELDVRVNNIYITILKFTYVPTKTT